jgi:hypothetical protein
MIKDFKSFKEGFFNKFIPKYRIIYEVDVKSSPSFPRSADSACPYYRMMIDYILPKLNDQIQSIKLSDKQYRMIIDEVGSLIRRIWRNYTYLDVKQLEREYHFFLTNDALGI